MTSHHLQTINGLIIVVAIAMTTAPTLFQVQRRAFDLHRRPSLLLHQSSVVFFLGPSIYIMTNVEGICGRVHV